MKTGDKVTATSDRALFAMDMFYSGTFAGYTKTGKARVKGRNGIRCYSSLNVKIA